MSELPTARVVGNNALLALATLPILGALYWAVLHVFSALAAIRGHGSPLVFTWSVTFILLWWVVLSWFERPTRTNESQAAALATRRVAVLVPVYNEKVGELRDCLMSLLEQTWRIDEIRVVDDGSSIDYTHLSYEFQRACGQRGILVTWVWQQNAGKRHAQMAAMAMSPDADIYVTLDSDSVLDPQAVEEGIKPFSRRSTTSVAGMVCVWNYRQNALTRLTGLLYTPFTRGYRAAQSKLGRVMVNSGTLAFYRGDVLRKYADGYANEQFMGRPMQMNDDSMMTFYGLLEGRTVHQPSSIAFTLVPSTVGEYVKQQKRWMRGTFIRTMWWLRYLKPTDPAYLMAATEMLMLTLTLLVLGALAVDAPAFDGGHIATFLIYAAITNTLVNYLVCLRYFTIRRSDESLGQALLTYVLAPIVGPWRLVVLLPLYVYCYSTFWKIDSWGTRQVVAA